MVNQDLYKNRYLDMIGKKFNHLLVLSFIDDKQAFHKQTLILCQCDCGKPKSFSAARVKNGEVKSCCMMGHWKGFGEISLDYFNRVKDSSVRRNLNFTIDIKYLWELFLKQDRKCAISGKELIFSRSFALRRDLQNASVDRIDSSKGYIPGNVQWVDKNVNNSKKKMLDEDFISMCHLISDYQRTKGN